MLPLELILHAATKSARHDRLKRGPGFRRSRDGRSGAPQRRHQQQGATRQFTSPHNAQVAVLEFIQHPTERWMRPILDLDPTIGPTAAIDAFVMFRHQALQPHQAGAAE